MICTFHQRLLGRSIKKGGMAGDVACMGKIEMHTGFGYLNLKN
jgi:hypothetical protein